MRTHNLILGAIALIIFSSCGASRYTNSRTDLKSIPEFAFIQPYAQITSYDNLNKGSISEEASSSAVKTITNIISAERFPFSDVIAADYSGENSDIRNWLITFPDVDPAKADRLRVPKSLQAMLEKSGHRYGVVIYSMGYTMTFVGQQLDIVEKAASKVIDDAIQKATGISGATNPTYNYTPSDPYGNVLYCAVIDNETERVIHFAKQVPFMPSHPTSNSDVSSLLHEMMRIFMR